MKLIFAILSMLPSALVGQFEFNLNTIDPPAEFENIHVHKLISDSLGTAFIIWVKDSVATHYHAKHTESIYVLEGVAEFWVGAERTVIAPGDYLMIPKGQTHGVKVSSTRPLKVLSIQAPEFIGKDRIFAGALKRPQ